MVSNCFLILCNICKGGKRVTTYYLALSNLENIETQCGLSTEYTRPIIYHITPFTLSEFFKVIISLKTRNIQPLTLFRSCFKKFKVLYKMLLNINYLRMIEWISYVGFVHYYLKLLYVHKICKIIVPVSRNAYRHEQQH